MRIHLVQRGNFKTDKRSAIVGIDSLVSYDYMGSAEFEFGALGKSLRRIVNKSLQVEMVKEIDRDGQRLCIIAEPNQMLEIRSFISAAAANNVRHQLKESLGFTKAEAYYDGQNFWWDIDNDWMMCFGKENADNILYALQKSAAKLGKKPS